MYPSQEELKEIFEYDPLTGLLTWKQGRSNVVAGSKVGTINNRGYSLCTINSKSFRINRLIWILMFGHIPEGYYIDHMNGVKSDNRLQNLRLATNSENQQNRSCPKNSTSGYRGVTWHKQMLKWMSRICHNKKRITIGFYDTAEEAYKAYLEYANNLYTHADRLPPLTMPPLK